MTQELSLYFKYKKTHEKYREENKERMKPWQKKYYLEHKEDYTRRREQHSFGGPRAVVLERDNYTCRICGMTDKEHREKWNIGITIDHIDSKGRNSKIKNHSLDNLQTLCLSCHCRKSRTGKFKNKGKELVV